MIYCNIIQYSTVLYMENVNLARKESAAIPATLVTKQMPSTCPMIRPFCVGTGFLARALWERA